MNKQLKIWRDDFLRYYNKTSLVMRIVIGAALSFGVVYYALEYHIRPQQAKVKELNKKLQEMAIVSDVELMMRDLDNRKRKAEARLKTLRTANRELAECCGGLNRRDIGKIILDLRLMLDHCGLKILSEDRAKPVVAPRRNLRRKTVKDTRIKLVLPESMACECYTFKILGTYQHIQRFLGEVYNADPMFFLNNIRLSRSREKITDRNFKQYKALECDFELHVPYRKTQP